ncbi:MAG: hypothetical protein HY246_23070 [Proteobacteria bacterium]|nr:hypothetical protein [Pseudomonadota bacterium]
MRAWPGDLRSAVREWLARRWLHRNRSRLALIGLEAHQLSAIGRRDRAELRRELDDIARRTRREACQVARKFIAC